MYVYASKLCKEFIEKLKFRDGMASKVPKVSHFQSSFVLENMV